MDYHLAEANLAWLRHPLADPRMAAFVNALEPINRLAEAAAGFVWRLETEDGNATSINAFDDERILLNMSVWSNIRRLYDYVYGSGHLEYFRRRSEWFTRAEREAIVMWYVPAGMAPTIEEARARFERLWHEGASPDAFTFRDAYRPDGRSLPAGWRRGPSF